MLKVRIMSSTGTLAALLQPAEERRHLPGRGVDDRRRAVRQDARQVVGDAAAGDVRHRP